MDLWCNNCLTFLEYGVTHIGAESERLGYDAVMHALNVVSDLYGCVIVICRISSNLFMNITRYTGVSLCYAFPFPMRDVLVCN